jgi:hypothetical protein
VRQHNNPPNTVRPEPAEGGEGDRAEHGGAAPASSAEAEKGMEQMAEKFREGGMQVYQKVEHDPQ